MPPASEDIRSDDEPLAACPSCGAGLPDPTSSLVGQSLGLAECPACGMVVPGFLRGQRPPVALNRDGTPRDDYLPGNTQEQDVADIFTKVLPWKGLSLRPGQRSMAVAVARAVQQGHSLLADAGVGIGKSFAYLTPLLKRDTGLFVLSTSTLVLQEQLAADVARLTRLLGTPTPQIIVAKGEGQYACRARLERALDSGRLGADQRGDAQVILGRLDTLWAISPRPGGCWERETLAAFDVSQSLRPYAGVRQRTADEEDRSDCQRCPYAARCGFKLMVDQRKAALRSGQRRLLIVNHGLLLSDLQLRSNGFPGLWPAPQAIVVDEAHDLEGKARTALTKSIAPRAAGRVLRTLALAYPGASDTLAHLDDLTDQLQRAIEEAIEAYPEPDADRIPLTLTVRELAVAVGQAAEAASGTIAAAGAQFRETRRSIQTAAEVLVDWYQCAQRLQSQDPGVVPAIEGRAVTAAPGSVAPDLARLLFGLKTPVILCSATLLAGGTFDEVRQALGAPQACLTIHAPSPFDYPARLRIFASPHYPRVPPARAPDEAAYMDAVVFPALGTLLAASRGRALILCTSKHRALLIHQHLRVTCDYRAIWQDERAAVEQFRADASSVLVGTGKLFTGIDIPGESLSLLVIDRIPYPVPVDPLYLAKEALALAAGKTRSDARWAWARTTLAQGSGRLIRSTEDWGVVALLDPRAAPGGQDHARIAAALPRGSWVVDRGDVEAFFREGPEPIEQGIEDGVAATARAFGRSPRLCFGFAPDALQLTHAEGNLRSAVTAYVPDGRGLALRQQRGQDQEPVAVICAADPQANTAVDYLVEHGNDVLVASLRGGPWAERLLLPQVPGRAMPAVPRPAWIEVAFARSWSQDPDRLEVAEACAHAMAKPLPLGALLVVRDARQQAAVEAHLQAVGVGWPQLRVAALAQAVREAGLWRDLYYLALLDVPAAAEDDLARLTALFAYDGHSRCAIIAASPVVDRPEPLLQGLGLDQAGGSLPEMQPLEAFRSRLQRQLSRLRWPPAMGRP